MLLTSDEKEKYDSVANKDIQLKSIWAGTHKFTQREVKSYLKKTYDEGNQEKILGFLGRVYRNNILAGAWVRKMKNESESTDQIPVDPPVPDTPMLNPSQKNEIQQQIA